MNVIEQLIEEVLQEQAVNQTLDDNKSMLEIYVPSFVLKPDKGLSDFLSKHMLNRMIGSGVYGRVFSFEDSDLILKIFSRSGIGEVERMQKISDDMWAGKNVSGNMHYFDVGVAGHDARHKHINMFYTIMPEIKTFESTPLFNKYSVFFEALEFNLRHALNTQEQELVSIRKNWHELSAFITHSVDSDRDYYSPSSTAEQKYENKKEFKEALTVNKSVVMKILDAMIRAHKQGGDDLHFGNLGFFTQQPDKLFFFDM